jgi:hypothetical protein
MLIDVKPAKMSNERAAATRARFVSMDFLLRRELLVNVPVYLDSGPWERAAKQGLAAGASILKGSLRFQGTHTPSG